MFSMNQNINVVNKPLIEYREKPLYKFLNVLKLNLNKYFLSSQNLSNKVKKVELIIAVYRTIIELLPRVIKTKL